MSSNWNAEFCGCCNLFPACCLACNGGVPLVQGVTHWEANGGNGGCGECILAHFLCCIGEAMNRTKLREKYGIHGSFVVDCLLYWIGCGTCMAVQEYREVRLRAHPK